MTPNTLDGAGRLLRLDSSVDMKLGDLGGMMYGIMSQAAEFACFHGISMFLWNLE